MESGHWPSLFGLLHFVPAEQPVNAHARARVCVLFRHLFQSEPQLSQLGNFVTRTSEAGRTHTHTHAQECEQITVVVLLIKKIEVRAGVIIIISKCVCEDSRAGGL